MKIKYSFFILGIMALYSLKARANCPELISPDSIVNEYASAIAKEFNDNDSTENRLEIILNTIRGSNGIASKPFSPVFFFELHAIFKKNEILSIQALLNAASKIKSTNLTVLKPVHLESIRRLYNRFVVKNPLDILFAPSASEIIKYRMAFGCTHFARAFMAICVSLRLFKEDEIRYVVSSAYKDFNAACALGKATKYDGKSIINGHQFVLVKMNGQWWFINTSNKKLEKYSAGNFESYRNTNLVIKFPSLKNEEKSGHNALLIRFIGRDSKDGACDNSLMRLMNLSVSGTFDQTQCAWNPYRQ